MTIVPSERGNSSRIGRRSAPSLTSFGYAITIKGDRASAKVHTTAANQPASDDTVALVREGGDWKIGALAGG